MPLGVTLPHPEATAAELKAALEEAWGTICFGHRSGRFG